LISSNRTLTLTDTGYNKVGVKVSRNAHERRSRAPKFKPGAFRLQTYWILQPEPTFLGPTTFAIVIP